MPYLRMLWTILGLTCLLYSQENKEINPPWWTKSSTGKFSVKSAWEFLRQKADVNEDLKHLWIKGQPFKLSFLAWRIWNGKVPVAALMHYWNPSISQNCRCCSVPEEETIEHLFLKGEIATRIWDHYFRAADLLGPTLNLKQTMRRWLSPEGTFRIQVVYQIVPIIILWFLWKRRNTILHGGSFSERKVIWEINDIILKVIRTRFKRYIGRNDWPHIVTELKRYWNGRFRSKDEKT
ncbi:hypothetical protein KY289_016525 [Solanum tuberosum]|nr:hypothetical protein KY289_016525 [Solanum tuberosum]